MWHVPARREIHTNFRWENLQKRGYLEDIGVNGRIILKQILKKQEGRKLQLYISGEAKVVDYCKHGHLALACINLVYFLSCGLASKEWLVASS
jgi:hypothetical protein